MAQVSLDSAFVAVMLERLGGKVTVTDAELLAVDLNGELLTYRDYLANGTVLEVRKPPVVVAGEVLSSGPLALPASARTVS